LRIGFIVFGAFVFFVAGFVMVAQESVEAHGGCYTFKASHNGTDMFNPNGGAVETAKNKLLDSIEAWRQEKRIKRVRIGKIRTGCGEWYIMYALPHHTCTARARVCR
jgi:hypothetical protein